MGAVRVIIRAGREQLDGIRAEDREIAEVLLPDWQGQPSYEFVFGR